jgi:hypothetical protein
MARRVPFRQTDVCRLLRAYKAAGVPQPTIKITKEGDLVAIPGDAMQALDASMVAAERIEQMRAAGKKA